MPQGERVPHDPDCDADLGPAVALFRGLADPRRLAIVHELARGERRVVDLTRALGLAQSTVSAHVACLADCGLVASRPVGRQSFYRLTRPELMTLLGAAEGLLAATGNAVALCPAVGDGHTGHAGAAGHAGYDRHGPGGAESAVTAASA